MKLIPFFPGRLWIWTYRRRLITFIILIMFITHTDCDHKLLLEDLQQVANLKKHNKHVLIAIRNVI